MSTNTRRQSLAQLRRRIARIENQSAKSNFGTDNIACGCFSLARGAVHEFQVSDYRDAPSAVGFTLAIANTLSAAKSNMIIWISHARDSFREGLLYGSGLEFYNIDTEQSIFIHARDMKSVLWAAEEATRCNATIFLECWKPHPLLNLTATRRLQLGAEQSGARLFLLRRAHAHGSSAARTRWQVHAAPSGIDPLDDKGIGHPRWSVELEKSRDGGRGRWVLEWDYAHKKLTEVTPHSGRVVSAMGDRLFKEAKAVA